MILGLPYDPLEQVLCEEVLFGSDGPTFKGGSVRSTQEGIQLADYQPVINIF